jgi:hypothetical protein
MNNNVYVNSNIYMNSTIYINKADQITLMQILESISKIS